MREARGEGRGIHRLGFVGSILVILVSGWSVMHTLSAPRASAEHESEKRAATADPAPPAGPVLDRPALPRAETQPAGTSRPAPRKIAAFAAERSHPLQPSPSTSAVGAVARLRSRKPVVIAAYDEFAAQAMLRGPRQTADLIHAGALFSISNGTAAAVQEEKDGVARVRILQGAMAGKEGWVPAAEISSK